MLMLLKLATILRKTCAGEVNKSYLFLPVIACFPFQRKLVTKLCNEDAECTYLQMCASIIFITSYSLYVCILIFLCACMNKHIYMCVYMHARALFLSLG